MHSTTVGPGIASKALFSLCTGPPVTGCSGPENAAFFETAVGRIGGIAANPLSACGGEHGLFLKL
jgi:hypothetical protein